MKTKQELETLKQEYEFLAHEGREENTEEADKKVLRYEKLVMQIDTCLGSLNRFEHDIDTLINMDTL